MKIPPLLYIIYLCRICICIDDALKPGGTEKNGPLPTGNGHIAIESYSSEKPTTLDLSNVDVGKVGLSENEEKGTESKEFTPHGGFYFEKVTDGTSEVWTAGDKEQCRHVHGHSLEELALLVLYVKCSDGDFRPKYYFKDGEEWKRITKIEYNGKMKDMKKRKTSSSRNKPSEAPSDPDVLNISNPNPSTIGVSTEGDEITCKVCVPNIGAKITTVVDSDQILWTASKGEKCMLTNHLSDGTFASLAIWIFGSTSPKYKYFESNGKRWNEISKEDYEKKSEEIRTPPQSDSSSTSTDAESLTLEDDEFLALSHSLDSSIPPLEPEDSPTTSSGPTGFILDIAKPDETNVIAIRESMEQTINLVYISKPKHIIVSVVENGCSLWTAKEGERCMLANVLSDDKSTFLAMWVDKANNNDFRYYVKNSDGSWHEITKEEYNEKSEGIRNSLKDFRERKFGVLDLINPNSSNIDISEESRAGVKWKECKPREGVRVTTILHDGSEVWKAKRGEKCLVANLLSDSKSTLVSIGIDSGVIPEYKYYAKNGTLWTPIQKDVYDGKSKTLREALQSSREVRGPVKGAWESFSSSIGAWDTGELASPTNSENESVGKREALQEATANSENESTDPPEDPSSSQTESPTETSQEPLTGETNVTLSADFLGTVSLNLQGSQSQQPSKPATLRTKLDSSFFSSEETKEDGTTVLKLNARSGVQAKKIKYDGKEVWSSDTTPFLSSCCSSAVLYFDGESPLLAAITTKDSRNEESTVYKYYFGGKWQDDNANSHNTKLAELKKGTKMQSTYKSLTS